MNSSIQIFLWDSAWNCGGYIPRSGTAGSQYNSYFYFWGSNELVSRASVLFPFPTNRAQGVQFLHTSYWHLSCFFFLIAILMNLVSVSWCFNWHFWLDINHSFLIWTPVYLTWKHIYNSMLLPFELPTHVILLTMFAPSLIHSSSLFQCLSQFLLHWLLKWKTHVETKWYTH